MAAAADQSRSDNAQAVPASDADWLLVDHDPSPEQGLPQDVRHAGKSSVEHQASGRRGYERAGSTQLAADHEQAEGIQGADAPSNSGPNVPPSGGVQQAERAHSRIDTGDDSRGVALTSQRWQGDSAEELQQPGAHSHNPPRGWSAATDVRPAQSGRHQICRSSSTALLAVIAPLR